MVVRTTTRYLIPAVAILALASLTACAPASGGSSTTGSASSPNSSSGQASTDLKACTLLSAAQAGSLMGQSFTGATSAQIAPGQDQCTYATSDDTTALQVIVYQPNSGVTWNTLVTVQGGVGSVKSVSGVGDKAILGDIELDVQTGNRYIAVEGGPVVSNASGAEAMARAIIKALG